MTWKMKYSLFYSAEIKQEGEKRMRARGQSNVPPLTGPLINNSLLSSLEGRGERTNH